MMADNKETLTLIEKVMRAINLADNVGRSRGSNCFAMNRNAVVALVDLKIEIKDDLQAQEAEIAALREALDRVKQAGVPLENIAFNLAQQSGRTLSKRECDLINLARKDWDAAIDSARAAQEAKA